MGCAFAKGVSDDEFTDSAPVPDGEIEAFRDEDSDSEPFEIFEDSSPISPHDKDLLNVVPQAQLETNIELQDVNSIEVIPLHAVDFSEHQDPSIQQDHKSQENLQSTTQQLQIEGMDTTQNNLHVEHIHLENSENVQSVQSLPSVQSEQEVFVENISQNEDDSADTELNNDINTEKNPNIENTNAQEEIKEVKVEASME